jgi:hypothetical protein
MPGRIDCWTFKATADCIVYTSTFDFFLELFKIDSPRQTLPGMEWRPIPGFEDYQVSSCGDVRHGEYIMGKHLGRNGYLFTRLAGKTIKTHRLIALAFLPAVEGKSEVDHINRDKQDNRVENLRWVNKTEQNINRDFPVSTSGHKYIYHHIRNGKIDGYRVKIERYKIKVFHKWFKILSDAIAARDQYLIDTEK